jgi:hypothetical protein
MITARILERATTSGQPSLVIKGGVALELLLRDRARPTKDLDIALHHPNALVQVSQFVDRIITSAKVTDGNLR